MKLYEFYDIENVGSNFKDSSKSKFEAENDLFDDITDITKEIQISMVHNVNKQFLNFNLS